MGVPTFFLWMTKKYPDVVADAIEPSELDGGDNVNGLEFDNLYLDMNGIIHPCCHPTNDAQPKTEDEMIENVFSYVDRIFNIVRPRRLLYMAIDGVAPRAKMNQQRSRRFRSAQETKIKQQVHEQLQGKFKLKKPAAVWDSNVITPGTPFMYKLSLRLQEYVRMKIRTSPRWRNIIVIFSDANVPGEGEHKIMEFIRLQRAHGAGSWDSSTCNGYNPNIRHCLYGMDADLIMLGLASHDPCFSIIREELFRSKRAKNEVKKKLKKQSGAYKVRWDDVEKECPDQVPFEFIHLSVLRKNLEEEFQFPTLSFPYNFESILDDFVFICFFVGNDFLPHLPSLQIREGAMDFLISLYKKILPVLGGYLTKDGGEINLTRVDILLSEIAENEDGILKRRSKFAKIQRRKQQQLDVKFVTSNSSSSEQSTAMFAQNAFQKLAEKIPDTKSISKAIDEAVAASQKEFLAAEDEARLGDEGWLDRYYRDKLKIAAEEKSGQHTLRSVCSSYVEGLQWVQYYYYRGCPSWDWYFPYHYAPMTISLRNADQYDIKFAPSEPAKPVTQLMSVLPADSSHCLPSSCRELMTDQKSPIKDFYPHDFKLDLNGKYYAWEALCLLPFIDIKRLNECIDKVEEKFTEKEKKRNVLGKAILFMHADHSIAKYILSDSKLNPEVHYGFSGIATEPISSTDVIQATYVPPEYKLHQSSLIPGVEFPTPEVLMKDPAAKNMDEMQAHKRKMMDKEKKELEQSYIKQKKKSKPISNTKPFSSNSSNKAQHKWSTKNIQTKNRFSFN